MQFLQATKEFYSLQMFQELKDSYDQRCSQLSSSFALALKRVEESEVLKEMRGEDLLEFRIQHVAQIAKQVMLNEQEMHMEKYMRTISELKAQLAVQRKKWEFSGINKDDNPSIINLKQEPLELKQTSIDSCPILANPQDAREQISSKEVKENQRKSCTNIQNKQSNQRQSKNTQIQMCEQLLQLEKKKFQQILKDQKQKMESTITILEEENRSLKGVNERLNEQNKTLFFRVSEATRGVISPINCVSPQEMTPLKRSVQRNEHDVNYQDIFELQHFAPPRIRKEQSYSYLPNLEKSKSKKEKENGEESLLKTCKKSKERLLTQNEKREENLKKNVFIPRPSSSLTKLKLHDEVLSLDQIVPPSPGKLTPQQPSHHPTENQISPRWPVVTRFQQIKCSFAKELASLRNKMADNREKLHSPVMRIGRPLGVRDRSRESPIRRGIQSPSRIHPPTRYGLRAYEHY